jgi:hypothetical protein
MAPIGTVLAVKGVMRGLAILDVLRDERTKGRHTPSISGQAMFGGGQ